MVAFTRGGIWVEDILSVVVATDICADLMDEGVDQFHFYTLNKPFITRDVCKALGILPINDNLIHANFRPVNAISAARKSAWQIMMTTDVRRIVRNYFYAAI